MADEVDDPQAARLQRLGMGPDHFPQLVPAGMFQHADGNHFVVFAKAFAHVRFVHGELIGQALLGDLGLYPIRLFRRGVHAGNGYAVALGGVEHEAAEAAAHVYHPLARLQAHFAGDVFHLRHLRFQHALLQVLVVGAGVHQVRFVQHLGVELRAQAVVEAGILLRLGAGAVVEAQAVPAIAQGYQRAGGVVETGVEADGQELAVVAVDVDVAVEVRLQEAHVAERNCAPSGPRGLDAGGYRGFARAALERRAVRQHGAKRQFGGAADFGQHAPQQGARQVAHGASAGSTSRGRQVWRSRRVRQPSRVTLLRPTAASASTAGGGAGRRSKAMRMLSAQLRRNRSR